MARPTDYSDELAAEICARVAGGLSLRKALAGNRLPAKTTVMRWAAEREAFRDQLTSAYEERGEALVDGAVEDLDQLARDARKADAGKRTAMSRERIQAETVFADYRFRRAAQLAPKKYGALVRHAGAAGGPVTVEIVRFGDEDPSAG